MEFQYTVYLTRNDNGDTVSEKTFTNYDKAVEFGELWKSDALSYHIKEGFAV